MKNQTDEQFKACEEYKLICSICKSEDNIRKGKGVISFVKSSGSKSLITHAKKHEALFIQVSEAIEEKRKKVLDADITNPQKKRQTVLDMLKKGSQEKYDKDDPKQVGFEKDIGYLVCKDLAPFRTVSHFGFQKLVYRLDPKITVHSTWYVANVILPSMRNHVVENTVKPLLESAQFCSLSFDLWMSVGNQDIYSLVAHVMSDEWELRTVFLALADIKDTTGVTVSESILEKLKQYDVKSKTICCVVDGGANLAKSVRLIAANVTCDVFQRQPIRGKCWAHILNNVLKKMMLEEK
jgi:hypothetical protein